MKLYGSNRSPFVVKVRIAIVEKGLPCAFEQIAANAPEVAAANPLCKIPTLVGDDGTAVYDSCVIVEYIDGLKPTPKLIPEPFADRIAVKRWEALGDGIVDASIAIMHDARLPPAQQRGAEVVDRQMKKIEAGIAAMATGLGDRSFCFGDSFTMADIACAAALRYVDQVVPSHDWRAAHPALARHFEALKARPSFKLD